MSISQPYPAPPIIDSIVELRLKNPLSKRDQDSVVRAIKPNYDKHEESGEVDVQVRIDQGKVEAQTSQPKPVHLFSNNDQTDFCRIEPSKLHWSRLPPYEGWDSFKGRIFRDLQRFPKKIGLPALARIGVRYRNRIDVPVDHDDICRYEEYLLIHLGLPALLDPHDGYQWKIEKHFASLGVSANIMSGTTASELLNNMAVMLDIDVFYLDVLEKTHGDLSDKIEDMRNLKNEIFEACITEKARASFR